VVSPHHEKYIDVKKFMKKIEKIEDRVERKWNVELEKIDEIEFYEIDN
jgi:hypothetical protein